MAKQYKLRYLPLFEQDLTAAKDYIALKLQNPAAASRLVEETEIAILKRLKAPLSFPPHLSNRHRQYPYYCIYVKNYTVFYVVIDGVMEVRRFIYSRRDFSQLL